MKIFTQITSFASKTLFAKITFLLVFLIGSSAQAQLLTENFSYTTAGNITAATANWTAHSGSTFYPQYTNTGLTFTGHAGSGVGGSMTLAANGVADVNRTFTSQSSGTVYMGCLVNFSSTTTNATDYFLHFNSSTFNARVLAQKSGTALRFGVSKAATPTLATTDFAFGTTYLLVVKYTFITGTANDQVDLWVLPAFASTEALAGTPLQTTTTGTDATALNAVAVRQGTPPVGSIDAIYVGTTWAQAVPPGITTPTLSTTTATSITNGGASSGGNVTADGGATVLARGVVYDTATAPTLSNSVVTTGSGTGSYVSNLTGLSVNTRYYYRAYATNSAGTAYGNESNFYTLANTPGVLVRGTESSNSIELSFNTATQNSNPAITAYAIQETGSGLYVQAGGSLGASAVWQTPATWSTITVNGLANSTTYNFVAKARNGDLVETAFGGSVSGTTTGAVAPVVTPGSPTGTYNVAFNYQIIASNSPTSYALSSGTLPTGINLNTTSGVISGTPTQTGTFNVYFTATNPGGTSTPALIAITINTASQSITFGTLTAVTYGVAPFNLTGTASSGLTVSYASSNENVATVSGNTITVIGAGTATITASQAGDANYSAATNVPRTLTVNTKNLTITGLTANNKVQDGTTTATLSGTPNLNGIVSGDEANVSVSGTAVAAFASAAPATGIAVTVTGYTLSGSKASNYNLTQPAGLTANITALGVPTATAATDVLYNGFTANWNAVTGTSHYLLDVYKTTQTQQSGDVFDNAGAIGASGWGETNVVQGTASGNDYLQLLTSTSTVITPTINFSVLSNASFKFKARNFGGPSATERVITVSISTNDGGTWTVLSTRSPGSTTLSDQTPFDLSAYTSSTVKIRIQTLAATGGRGVGIDDIILTANQLVNTNTYVLQNQNVGNVTSYNVTGLDAETTYHYTVRAVNGSVTSAHSNTINVTTLPAPVTWNGSAWSNITGPTASLEAVIQGAYSTNNDTQNPNGFTAKKLTLSSGSFTINSGDNVTVVENVTNAMAAANFVVENNANLLQQGTANTNSGNITVKRNSATIKRLDYTLWSSPVTGQGLYAFSPFTFASRFYTYNSANDQYAAFGGFDISGLNTDGVNGTDNNNVPFATATGYLIRTPWNHPTAPFSYAGTFTGVPHSGDISLINLTSGRYYATGNPYPSTIDADQFIIDNNIGDDPQTPGDGLYFWRKTNNANQTTNPSSSYATYTTAGGVQSGGDSLNIVPSGIIQVGEGFLVKTTSTSLVFNNNQRVANNDNQFLRTAAIERNRIWLNLSDSAANVNQMMIAYMTDATQNIDPKIDARYINDSPTALNNLLDNQEFAIQGRSLPFTASDIVPLAFKAANPGNYSIAIARVDGLFADGNQKVYLKDNLTSTVHDLSSGAYTFASATGTFNTRFEIIYQAQLSTPSFNANSVVVYSQDNGFAINSGNAVMQSVKVFDIRGRLLLEKNNIDSSQTVVSAGNSNQVLLIQITSEDNVTVTKKVIR